MRARGDLVLSGRWPGFSAKGTVVVAIDPASWAPPTQPLLLDARAYSPKRELHVTVVGRALGQSLLAAIAAGALDEAALRAAFEQGPWRLRRSGWWLPLRREATAEKPAAASVIEPVALPEMARFHARLAALLDRPLPVPPPHVTLFVEGDAEGIGVPDAATLARLRDGPAVRAR